MHSGNRTFRTNLSIKMLLNVCLLNVITLVFFGHSDCETALSDKEIRPGTTDRPRPGCSPLCTKCWCYRIPCDQDQPPVVGVTGLFNSEEAIREMIEDNTAASIAKSVPVQINGKVFSRIPAVNLEFDVFFYRYMAMTFGYTHAMQIDRVY